MANLRLFRLTASTVDGRGDSRTVRHFGSALSCPFLPRRDRPSARRAEAGIRDEICYQEEIAAEGAGVERQAGSIVPEAV